MLSFDPIKVSFIAFSAIISFSDIKTGAVMRFAFVLAFPFFIMLKIIYKPVHFQNSLIGLLAGLIIFSLVYLLSRKRLGLADVWYSALIGLLFGFWQWYTAIGIACITGIFFILIFKHRKIPFIPFMAIGSILVLSIFQ